MKAIGAAPTAACLRAVITRDLAPGVARCPLGAVFVISSVVGEIQERGACHISYWVFSHHSNRRNLIVI